MLDVLDAVKREYMVDERNVFLLGFSQGASLAFSAGLRHPDVFRGVIPVGGWMDPAEHPEARVRRAAKSGRFLICHSPADQVVPFEAGEKAVAFMGKEGIPHRLVTYDGGHTLPVDLMKRITSWIANPTLERIDLEKAFK